MQPSLFAFLHEQLQTVPPVQYGVVSGKTVVVIGANAGIGFEATKHFAQMKPGRIILGCRSKERGEAAVASKTSLPLSHCYRNSFYKGLKVETGYESAELWEIDLAQISSVVKFAERFEKDGGRLDILLENAAIIPIPGQQLTADGYEPVSVIRFLSCAIMTVTLIFNVYLQISGQQLVPLPSCSSLTSNNASHR